MKQVVCLRVCQGHSQKVLVCACVCACVTVNMGQQYRSAKTKGFRSQVQRPKVSGAKSTNVTSAGFENSGMRGEVGLQRETHNL